MIVRTLDEITETELDVRGERWRARRLFVRDDGLGFSLSETTVDGGAEMNLWYKHHQEACFVVEGEAEITERDTGIVHRIGPGSAYAPQQDRHAIRVLAPLPAGLRLQPGAHRPRDPRCRRQLRPSS
jgi:L-ectoine synthase